MDKESILKDETDLEYYLELPKGYIKLSSFKSLFTTKTGESTITTENAVIREGVILILYNPVTNKYYPRYLSNSSNRVNLLNYMKDGNLYIKESDLKY